MEPTPVFQPPAPRAPVADPALWRPDWTTGSVRNPNLLWLDKNENLDPILAAVTQRVVAEAAGLALATYPDSGPFYRKLAAQVGVPADYRVLTAGSDGTIRSVFEAYINPGDVVVHTAPTFAMCAVYCQMYGARRAPGVSALRRRPSVDGGHGDGRHRSGAAQTGLSAQPDSPTGTVFASADLRRIIEGAGRGPEALTECG